MGRVARARRERNEWRRRIRGLEADNEVVPSTLRTELARAEVTLSRMRRARRSRRRQAWRDLVDGLGDLLGYADDLLDLDEETRLGRLGAAIVAEAGIPVTDLARGVELARVVLAVAEGPIDEEADDDDDADD